MRAIDADRLIDDLKHDVAMDQDSLDYEELTDSNREKIQFDKDCKQNAIDLLQNAPAIEPETIRCKDCKHSEFWYRDKRRCFLWHEEGIGVFEDGFCNYGERRTDEGD